jgi:hypothetical protein
LVGTLTFVAVFTIETAAPGITAPVWSRTVPLTAPALDWPKAQGTIKKTTSSLMRIGFIDILQSEHLNRRNQT